VKRSERYRLAISAGWLLTPVVVWAAAFCGAWLGAAVRRGTESLLGGGLVAGTLVLAAWILALRRIEKKGKQTPQKATRR
jgi:predicted membrane-bound spermidine synthase